MTDCLASNPNRSETGLSLPLQWTFCTLTVLAECYLSIARDVNVSDGSTSDLVYMLQLITTRSRSELHTIEPSSDLGLEQHHRWPRIQLLLGNEACRSLTIPSGLSQHSSC